MFEYNKSILFINNPKKKKKQQQQENYFVIKLINFIATENFKKIVTLEYLKIILLFLFCKIRVLKCKIGWVVFCMS